MSKIKTQHEWVDKLETLSVLTAAMQLRRKKDVLYCEAQSGTDIVHDADAYNFANSDIHDKMLVRVIDDLLQRSGATTVKNLLGELTFRKTYGAYSELAAYDWLSVNGIPFTTQRRMTAADVVNPNGSTIDGQMTLNGKVVNFDIKGFGFLEHKLSILRKRLGDKFQNKEVVFEGGTYDSIDSIQDLLEWTGFSALLEDLRNTDRVRRGSLTITVRDKRTVSISIQEPDPIKAAINNRLYPLEFGEQFTRMEPFALIFVVHPWFSMGSLHQNFVGYTDQFCKKLAELTFQSFANDQDVLFGEKKSDLAKLLSSLVFINVWPEESSRGKGAMHRVYINKSAIHPLNKSDFIDLEKKWVHF